MMTCVYCGSSSKLHVYGETDPSQAAGLELPMPVYACQVCDPLADWCDDENFKAATRAAMKVRKLALGGMVPAAAAEGAAAVACAMYNERAARVAKRLGCRPPAPMNAGRFMRGMSMVRQ